MIWTGILIVAEADLLERVPHEHAELVRGRASSAILQRLSETQGSRQNGRRTSFFY